MNIYFNDCKYTLSTEFVLAQVRGNNHWRTSQIRLKILNYRTLRIVIRYTHTYQTFFINNVNRWAYTRFHVNVCLYIIPQIQSVQSES
jgi:hypothetical protein